MRVPPREPALVSWIYVILWTLLVFATIPMARTIQGWVDSTLGREAFLYMTLGCIVLALLGAGFKLKRISPRSWTAYIWLILVAGFYVAYSWSLRSNPEEAFHFVQYGILGVLAFRAASHRQRDFTVYLTAALIGSGAGILDEAIQWLTPERYWDIRDIGLNVMGASVIQIGLAKGLRPAGLDRPVDRKSIQRICRLAAVVLVLLGLSLLNTPKRIAAYDAWLPFLNLGESKSMMVEYGTLIEDPEAGTFKSRFSAKGLKEEDTRRGPEASNVLKQRDSKQYSEFIKKYSPVTDPFLHEARVHIGRRDHYFGSSWKFKKTDPWQFKRHLTIVYRENLILERYFTHTLRDSGYAFSQETVKHLLEHQLDDFDEISAVSKGLFTRFNDKKLAVVFLAVLLAVLGVERYFSKATHEKNRSRPS